MSDDFPPRWPPNTFWRLGPGHIPIPCSAEEFARALANDEERIVAKTMVAEGVEVSTIFLGMDHSFGLFGRPLFFETMIFEDYDVGQQWRWSTWDEALAGHNALCELIRAKVAIAEGITITTGGTVT